MFYQQNYKVSLHFERVKEVQLDTMLNIRGLQISYLLSLNSQTAEYLKLLKKMKSSHPNYLMP